MTIEVTSTAIEEGGMIPRKYTADGENVSPPLAWTGVPDGTKSIALLNDDPDAPVGDWVHWIIFNMNASTAGLPEGVTDHEIISSGAKLGKNDFGSLGYGGPAPPHGTHRYYFKIYALDTLLNLESGAKKPQLLKAMEGHILAEGQLMGKYAR